MPPRASIEAAAARATSPARRATRAPSRAAHRHHRAPSRWRARRPRGSGTRPARPAPLRARRRAPPAIGRPRRGDVRGRARQGRIRDLADEDVSERVAVGAGGPDQVALARRSQISAADSPSAPSRPISAATPGGRKVRPNTDPTRSTSRSSRAARRGGREPLPGRCRAAAPARPGPVPDRRKTLPARDGADDLAGEERVSLGTLHDRVDQFVGGALREVRTSWPVARSSSGSSAIETWLRRPPPQLGRRSSSSGRASARAARGVAARLKDELEEVEQRVARPVQVLEGEHQRAPAGGRLDESAPRREERRRSEASVSPSPMVDASSAPSRPRRRPARSRSHRRRRCGPRRAVRPRRVRRCGTAPRAAANRSAAGRRAGTARWRRARPAPSRGGGRETPRAGASCPCRPAR